MPENVEYLYRKKDKYSTVFSEFTIDEAERTRTFHRTFPEYTETPLVSLNDLSRNIGLRGVFIKDESFRFNLNAFKVLGGSYAMGKILSAKDGTEMSFSKLISAAGERDETTFVTATDGNHGRGVAWSAQRLRCRSVVYMPKGTAAERLDNILKLGSDASITDLSYDDAVRLAKENADRYGWILLQDTSFDGYTEIPLNIMKGYMTMGLEAYEQLGNVRPTHIFLQAGVGAMAGSMAAFFTNAYADDPPEIVVVEPKSAACIFNTARADDGRLHYAQGEMTSMMAGLCCGEPCSIGWNILRSSAEHYVITEDDTAAEGMRLLAHPVGEDKPVVSGESGAVTTGLVYKLMTDRTYEQLKKKINLNENSVVLCISTEGDTDSENYLRIVG